jgi:hypothetical protein
LPTYHCSELNARRRRSPAQTIFSPLMGDGMKEIQEIHLQSSIYFRSFPGLLTPLLVGTILEGIEL